MSTIIRSLCSRLVALLLVGAVVATARADGGRVDLPRFPSISPDGSTIAFSWRGDLWTVGVDGGTARRLTTHPGDDLRTAWSPDGRTIAFDSDRAGAQNIFLMSADGTGVRALTNLDRPCTLAGFGVDGEGAPVVTFHAAYEGDVYREHRPYMINVDGTGGVRRVHDAFGSSPLIAPDGRRVVFARGGYYEGWDRRHYRGPEASDAWLYDRTTGAFRRLTLWDGNDGKARWAGERTLVYLSDRELDCVNLYWMSATEGQANSGRLTDFRVDDVKDFDVTPDGARAVFTVWDTIYTMDLKAAQPTPRAITVVANQDEGDRFEIKSVNRSVSEAALSPDGTVMAVVAYGEVYVRNVEEHSPTRRVTDEHAREKDIAWSPDGLKLYFTSDRGGHDGIYAATVLQTREEIKTEFTKATTPPADEPGADEPGAEEPAADAPKADPGKDDDGGDDAKAAEDDDDADTAAKDKKDAKKDLPKELRTERWRDAVTFTITPVVVRDTDARRPAPSPDGRHLAFRGVRGDVDLLDLDTGGIRPFLRHWDSSVEVSWSPDGRSIAYAQSDMDFNRDIFIAPADGSAPAVNITRHPDNDDRPRWSADGKVLVFESDRVNDENDIWIVSLDKDLDAMSTYDRLKMIEEAAKAAKKRKPLPVKNPADEAKDDKKAKDDEKAEDGSKGEAADGKALDLEDAYRRVRRLTRVEGPEGQCEITPGGDRIVFTARGDDPGLYSIKWDGSEQKKLSGAMSIAHLNLTGDTIVGVSGGQATTVKVDGGKRESVDIEGRMRIDLQAQSSQKFMEAARFLGEMFYSPTMNGVDWPALTVKYHELARQARTSDEFNWVANHFIGELNGSHLGIRAPGESNPNAQPIGRLGIDTQQIDGGFRVTGIVPEGPVAAGPMALRVGDVITAIEFRPVTDTDSITGMLTGHVGDEIVLSIARTDETGAQQSLNVLATPISYGAERSLRYEAWRTENARLVSEWSGGTLGYVHIEGMSQPSLDVFERDLYAAAAGRKGLIVDVRNNGGGWTADRVLASIMVQPHAYTIPRGADPDDVGHYPQDRLFIQRYTLPMNLLCNEKSFSNAEIVSHAFKTLKRGTVVGQQTHGGVISTGGTSLIDGTSVRMPFRGWYLLDGTDMEKHGCVPDLIVDQTPEAEARGTDEQLKAAVDDLLRRVH